MSTDTKEKGLEQHITDYLVSANGYVLRTSGDYDNVNCIDTDLLFHFLEKTPLSMVAEEATKYQTKM